METKLTAQQSIPKEDNTVFNIIDSVSCTAQFIAEGFTLNAIIKFLASSIYNSQLFQLSFNQ